jgi:competence protein ComEA
MKARSVMLCFLLSAVIFPTQLSAQKNLIKQRHVMADKIDLNRADLSTLIHSVKGIGKKRAEAIVAYRETHHGFKSLEEFAEIKGFGQRFLEKNRDKLKEVFVIR